MSGVTCQVSRVKSLVLSVTFFYFSSSFFSSSFSIFLDKLVELVGGGSVINGAYPV